MQINHLNHDQQMIMLRLSTGQRINTAADDAARLAISEKMQGQISGENTAARNMHDSGSLYQTAEGALNSTHSLLHRMRELSVQANNGSLTESDRGHLQQEFNHLRETVDAIGNETQYNTKNILDGSLLSMKTTTDANGQTIDKGIDSALSANLGLDSINLQTDPSSALTLIDDAIGLVSSSRGTIGVTQNRLDHAINLSETKQINMTSAQSRIRDADIALEMNNLNRTNILQQTYLATQKMQYSIEGQFLNLFT